MTINKDMENAKIKFDSADGNVKLFKKDEKTDTKIITRKVAATFAMCISFLIL